MSYTLKFFIVCSIYVALVLLRHFPVRHFPVLQIPVTPFLPLARRGPHLIQQCLGPPHAPPQTAAPTVEALSHTDAVKSPLVTMARHKFAPKVLLLVDRSPNPTIYLIPRPVRPTMPNGIRIRSAVLAQCTGQPDGRTYARTYVYVQTDRSPTGKFDDYWPLRSESVAA